MRQTDGGATTYSRRTSALLWGAQALLAVAFLFAGGTKLVFPVAELTRQTPLIPGAFFRVVGVVEVLGASGLVLPGLLRLRPALTPLAALGLTFVMCGAVGVALTTARPADGGPAVALIPVAFGLVLLSVAYGRWAVVPHGARAAAARAEVVRPRFEVGEPAAAPRPDRDSLHDPVDAARLADAARGRRVVLAPRVSMPPSTTRTEPQLPLLLERDIAMSKVVAIMSMSLDGYVADRNDGVAEVFDWYANSGDVAFHTGGSEPMTFKVSGPSAEHLRGLWSELGAVLTGRRTFEVAQGWGGNHAWGPAFVLTHQIPAGWPRPDSTVYFVTDGVESAVRQAKAAAAGKSVGVHGADTIQQLLNAGLLDELHIDVAAVLLGSGVRLFDRLARTPAVLGDPTVVAGVGVTHLRYPVHKA